ncbi:MAG: hypothetical protein JXR41_13215, partial [Bacteroidales bacterium]|nr:hypothetical protein [Bacteroidales bacterium]
MGTLFTSTFKQQAMILCKNMLFLLLIVSFSQCGKHDTINLEGEWYYRLDEENTGIDNKWYIQGFK